jgi:hypothetical protein
LAGLGGESIQHGATATTLSEKRSVTGEHLGQRAEGKSNKEAFRYLKLHLVRVVWRAMQPPANPADFSAERGYPAGMRRTIKVLLGLCLVAVVVFGSVKLFESHEGDGRSDYEKGEDEFRQERAEGKDTFPLRTPASRERFVALYCLYMARSKDQLRRCARRPVRDVYRSDNNEYAWLFADEDIDYCDRRSSAGRFCDPANVKAPIHRIETLIDR